MSSSRFESSAAIAAAPAPFSGLACAPAGDGFDEAALEAAQKLAFEPARKADGTPFAARFPFPILTHLGLPVEPPPIPRARDPAEMTFG